MEPWQLTQAQEMELKAKQEYTAKLAAKIGATTHQTAGWMQDAKNAGVAEQYTEAHYVHLRMRIAETGNPALLDAFNAKMADTRLSQEQKISDGYRLLDRHYDRTAKNPEKWAEILAMQQAISTDPTFNKLCKISPRGSIYGCAPTGFAACVTSLSENVPFPADLKNKINQDLGTNVDFDQILEWEGNRLTGYIPWGNGAKDNKSGVTVAGAFDLGGHSEYDVRQGARLYPPPFPLETLLQKLRPFFLLNRQGACDALSDHPLTLTQEEGDWLTYWKLREHTRLAKKAINDLAAEETTKRKAGQPATAIKNWPSDRLYPAMPTFFGSLDQKAQTVLTSRRYQWGNLAAHPKLRPDMQHALSAFMYQNDALGMTLIDPKIRAMSNNERLKKEWNYLSPE